MMEWIVCLLFFVLSEVGINIIKTTAKPLHQILLTEHTSHKKEG